MNEGLITSRMPCSWHGKSIIVLDSVIIQEPYGVENVRPIEGTSGDRAIERVKRVVSFPSFLPFLSFLHSFIPYITSCLHFVLLEDGS